MRILLFLLVLLINLKAADSNNQIFVDSRRGYAFLYMNGVLVKKQDIFQKAYRKAVLDNKLHIFWGIPELQVNEDLSLPIPIKIAGFKHVNQIGGTCNEASYREWAVYFAGELIEECPALKDVGLFNTALIKDTFTVSYENTLARAKVGRDGAVQYSGSIDSRSKRASNSQIKQWLKKYMNINTAISVPIHNSLFLCSLSLEDPFPQGPYRHGGFNPEEKVTHIISKHLLLGNGIVAYCELKSRGGHALNLFGTEGSDVYVSTWGRIYKGEFPEFGQFEFSNYYSILVPSRSKSSAVVTGLEKHIGNGAAVNVLVADEVAQAEGIKLPFLQIKDLLATPQKYNNKEVILYANFKDTTFGNSRGFRIDLATSLNRQSTRKSLFEKHLELEFPSKNSYELLKNRNHLVKGTFRYRPQSHELFMGQVRMVNCVILDVYK